MTSEILKNVDDLLSFNRKCKLESIIPNSTFKNYTLGDFKGVYAFWLDNRNGKAEGLNRKFKIKGKINQEPHDAHWNWHLEKDFVLLYVGKSMNVENRIRQHLRLGTTTKKWKELAIIKTVHQEFLFKPTTSCQLRSGIEHLIKDTSYQNGIAFIREFVHLSFIKEDDFAKRFYMEDLAVGKGIPWFNLDSER